MHDDPPRTSPPRTNPPATSPPAAQPQRALRQSQTATAPVTSDPSSGALEIIHSVKRQGVNQLKSINERFETGDWHDISAHELALVAPWRILIVTIKQLLADRVLMRASSLAFITVTSLVPILVVAGSLIMVFSGSGEQEGMGLVDVIQSYLMPVAGDRISSFIRNAIERTNESGVGSLGGLALIFTAVTLVMEIEDSFNDIWKVNQRRTLRTRVLLFYTLVTIGPLVLTLTIIQSTRIGIAIEQLGTIGSLAHQLVPLLSSCLMFGIANKLLPNTRVEWRSAWIAALVSALAFEATKFGFTYYISNVVMARYDQIYGPLSLIPVFLLWVYISWVLVLFGAELSYCLQHLRQLMRSDRVERHFSRAEDAATLASPFIGIELMAPIAWHFFKGKPPLDVDQIVELSAQSHVLGTRALKRLVQSKFLIRVEREGTELYLPARPLDQIRLIDLIDAFEIDAGRMRPSSTIRQVAQRLTDARQSALQDLTCQDLAVAMALGTALEHLPDATSIEAATSAAFLTYLDADNSEALPGSSVKVVSGSVPSTAPGAVPVPDADDIPLPPDVLRSPLEARNADGRDSANDKDSGAASAKAAASAKNDAA
jgi:membrane protein